VRAVARAEARSVVRDVAVAVVWCVLLVSTWTYQIFLILIVTIIIIIRL
jgi:hypothetical protein